jgi:hypothetical protein
MERPMVKSDPGSSDFDSPVNIGDTSTTLKPAQIYRGLMQGSPNEEITLIFPSAVELIRGAPKVPIAGFVKRFSIRNDGRAAVTVVPGEGGTSNGIMTIRASPDAAHFALRYTSVTSSMEAYQIIRE